MRKPAANTKTRRDDGTNHQKIDSKYEQIADKAELLTNHGKDEICLFFRQIIQLALASHQKALAENAARAERDLRLGNLVSRPQHIAVGVQKRHHPRFLVITQLGPHDRHGSTCPDQGQPDIAPWHTGHKQDGQAAKRQRQRGTKIRLLNHKNERHCNHHQRRQISHDIAHTIRLQIVEISGQCQNQGNFGGFGWLKGKATNADPAGDTIAASDKEQGHQYTHRGNEQRIGPHPQNPEIDKGQHHHDPDTDAATHRMPACPGRP